MTLFERINENIDRVKKDVCIGLIPCATLKHWQIYARYDSYRKAGHNVSKSALFTSFDFDVSDRHVMNIKKEMETEI
jgi:hypothetical protein